MLAEGNPSCTAMKNKKKRQQLELEIEAIGFEGKSIARHDGKVFFVEGGIPGDTVIAETRRKRRRYTEAVIAELLTPSPDRTEPLCSHFGTCGGCKWQHLQYEKQLEWKTQNVRDAFTRLGGIEPETLHNTVGCGVQFHYRNKMEFTYGDKRWLTEAEIASEDEIQRDFALGMHIPGRFDRILDLKECHLMHQDPAPILDSLRERALRDKLKAFSTRTHEGFLRNIVFRTTRAGEMMCILITTSPQTDAEQSYVTFAEEVCLQHGASTFMHAVSNSKSSVAQGEIVYTHGSEYITETLCGVDYTISPFSFFQTNPAQAEVLFTKALDLADLKKDHVVWDLYCGAGTITLIAAQRVDRVYGIEVSSSSIKDAHANAARNNIENATFFEADMLKAAKGELLAELPAPDVIIVDPPRAGMHPDVTEKLLDIGAKTIVYISCNPATQARDCAVLHRDYDVKEVQPVDMFPNTWHIESIALLQKRV